MPAVVAGVEGEAGEGAQVGPGVAPGRGHSAAAVEDVVVDPDLAADPADPGLAHVLRELGDRGEREVVRARERVRRERRVTGPNQHQIAIERVTGRAGLAALVDHCPQVAVGAEAPEDGRGR